MVTLPEPGASLRPEIVADRARDFLTTQSPNDEVVLYIVDNFQWDGDIVKV
jgi:hypothetical protein